MSEAMSLLGIVRVNIDVNVYVMSMSKSMSVFTSISMPMSMPTSMSMTFFRFCHIQIPGLHLKLDIETCLEFLKCIHFV